MDILKLYYRFAIINLKSKIEYRFSFFMDIFVQFTRHSVNYISIWVIVDKFNFINGWSFYEMMVLYNLNLLTYAICGVFFWIPTNNLGYRIQNGGFDSFLIRPISPFKYMVISGFQHQFIGHITISVFMLVYSFYHLHINWTVYKVVLFFLMILCAVIIHIIIMVLTSSTSFWFIKSGATMDVMIYDIRRFIEYPISIYNKFIQILLTFIIPYAFVNYYPCEFLFEKSTKHPNNNLYILPLILIFMIFVTKFVWRAGLSKYESTGS